MRLALSEADSAFRDELRVFFTTQIPAEILERAFGVLKREEIPVLMMSQGASKTNISLIVGGEGTGPKAIRALHAEFFE